MPTITEKLTELNNIKTNIKEAIKSKGVVVEDTTPFNQYPSKIGQLSLHLFNSNTYACSIDGSEIDTEEKKSATIQEHCENAIAAGKTEIFFVFKGEIPRLIFSNSFTNKFSQFNNSNIQKVSIIFDSQANIPAVLDGSCMFLECDTLTTILRIDTSNVASMSYMFFRCSSLTSIPHLDTSNVIEMECTFYGCSSLTSIPALNVSKVTRLFEIFASCISLENIDMYRMKVSFSVAGTKLNAATLNKLFTNLATVTTTQTITITGTPGAATCDRSIATSKGWTVVG